MRLFKKATVTAMALLSAGIFVSSVNASEEQVVKMYNWSDYVAEDTLENFRKETGIRVIYDVFDSNEVLEAKLLSGRSGYDIVVPSNSFLTKQIKAGVYSKLNRDQLPNHSNLDADLMSKLQTADPGNEHSVPYLWGTNGIGYNVAQVKAALGEDAPTDSLELIFNPKYAEKLGKCGLAVLDSPDEMIPQALLYLGLNPNSHKASDYKAAGKLLATIRPHITYFHSSRYISDLANGDICVAYGFSGDVFQAKARAEEAGNGHIIEYKIPKEGANLWFDMLAIPKDAPNKENAHKFVNYLLRPDVIAGITNYVAYANGNTASMKLIDKEVRENPAIYPSDEVINNLYVQQVRPLKAQRSMTRIWTGVKTGRK